jgi:DNA invertase Pin-like site-specific DNA recombinase
MRKEETHGGRQPKLTPDDLALLQEMRKTGRPMTNIARRLTCSRHTISRALGQVTVEKEA